MQPETKKTTGIPLYEHDINRAVIGTILGKDLNTMYESRDPKILDKLFKNIAEFHIDHGYDTYSFEGCFTELVQGGRGLNFFSGITRRISSLQT